MLSLPRKIAFPGNRDRQWRRLFGMGPKGLGPRWRVTAIVERKGSTLTFRSR
jgi:hypothetical protein